MFYYIWKPILGLLWSHSTSSHKKTEPLCVYHIIITLSPLVVNGLQFTKSTYVLWGIVLPQEDLLALILEWFTGTPVLVPALWQLNTFANALFKKGQRYTDDHIVKVCTNWTSQVPWLSSSRLPVVGVHKCIRANEVQQYTIAI